LAPGVLPVNFDEKYSKLSLDWQSLVSQDLARVEAWERAMTKTTIRLLIAFAVLVLQAGMAQSQSSEQEPLGDKEHAQQELLKKQEKQISRRVYTNWDVVTRPAPLDGKDAKMLPSSRDRNSPRDTTGKAPQPESTQESGKKAESMASQAASPPSAGRKTRSSVFDRPEDPDDDLIVVPAGTGISVDLATSTVSEPVRVGFATPIPALSKVTTQIFGSPSCGSDFGCYYCGSDGFPTLTSVTVGGVTYPVKASGFTLTAPLIIERYPAH
jgi:hypothetical protein